MVKVGIFLLVALILNNGFAQESLYLPHRVSFEKIDTRDGLPHNSIYCIIQDKMGFYWIGTGGGLSRYDGYSFKNYTTIPGTDKRFSYIYNMIEIFEKDRSYIWLCADEHGLIKFDPVTESALTYDRNSNFVKNFNTKYTTSIFLDSRNWLWVGTGDSGVYLLDMNTKQDTLIFQEYAQ